MNAFASPGGIVHITRGALGLIRSEAELAGVLAHEIGHVAHKHTVNAIKKNKTVQLGTTETLSNRAPFVDKMANKAYEMVLENKFDRGDEMDADKESATLTENAGYAPGTLAAFLARLDERNKDQPAQNGLFASHPETKERIDAIKKPPVRRPARRSRRATRRTSSTSRHRSPRSPPSRMARRVSRDRPSPRTTSPPDKNKDKKEDPPKKGFGLNSLKPSSSSERETAQVSASGGSRGLGADRAAKGGGNPTVVKASVTDAELAAFKKEIV